MAFKTRFNLSLLSPLVLAAGFCSQAFADDARTSQVVNADNTLVNKKNEKQLTAEDQVKGSSQDVEITRKLRRYLTDDDNLSTYAKNIKIVTLSGVVTLNGPVRSRSEKQSIEEYARRLVRSPHIQNQLDIVPEQSAR